MPCLVNGEVQIMSGGGLLWRRQHQIVLFDGFNSNDGSLNVTRVNTA